MLTRMAQLNGMKLGERQVSVDHVKAYQYPADSRYNVRIEQPRGAAAVASEDAVGGGDSKSAALDAGATERREKAVMERLRAMQKRRLFEEREARSAERAAEDGNEYVANGYRAPMVKVERVNGDGDGKQKKVERVGDKRGRVESSSGDKEARRLQRAAIREERRRRRAKRLAQGGDPSVAQG